MKNIFRAYRQNLVLADIGFCSLKDSISQNYFSHFVLKKNFAENLMLGKQTQCAAYIFCQIKGGEG